VTIVLAVTLCLVRSFSVGEVVSTARTFWHSGFAHPMALQGPQEADAVKKMGSRFTPQLDNHKIDRNVGQTFRSGAVKYREHACILGTISLTLT